MSNICSFCMGLPVNSMYQRQRELVQCAETSFTLQPCSVASSACMEKKLHIHIDHTLVTKYAPSVTVITYIMRNYCSDLLLHGVSIL